MKIEIIKNVRWSISPSKPQISFKIGEILELDNDFANELIKNSYAIKLEKDGKKSISEYDNKAMQNIPENKEGKKQYKKRYKK